MAHVTIEIDGSEEFLKTCEDLRNNQPSLEKVLLMMTQNISPENWSATIESFRTNHTVKHFSLMILPEVLLEDQNILDLKDLIVNSRCWDKLTIYNASNETNNFNPLGQAISKSDLHCILLSGFNRDQYGLAAFCDNCHMKRCFLSMFDCQLGSEDVDALVRLIENGREKSIRLEGLTFIGGTAAYCRIAHALAESTTIKYFSLVDEIKDECVAIAFGKALTENVFLRHAGFTGLCPMAIPHIVGGIEKNVVLIGAKIGVVNSDDDLEQVQIEAQARVAHVVAMNAAGRRYFRQREAIPYNIPIEAFWSHKLIQNKDSHAVVFSLIQEHPHLFLSSFTLKEESQKHKVKPMIVLMVKFCFLLFCFFYYSNKLRLSWK